MPAINHARRCDAAPGTRQGRRQFLRSTFVGAAGFALTHRLSAQGGGPAPITPLRMTDRITALSGNGGNVIVVTGPDGVLMIDGGLIGRGPDMLRAVAGISPERVRVLFNTHYHFDHVGSNELAAAAGARIIAHEKVAARVRTSFRNEAMDRMMDALAPIGFPADTFTTGGSLSFGPERLDYTHEAGAHTDGDAWVFIPTANVLHTGDLFWMGRYPVVDYSAGGSFGRMVDALGRLLPVGDERTRVIPGHGRVDVTKADMRIAHERWGTINERLEAFARQGRSVEEVIAAEPTRQFDAAVGVQNAAPFVRQAYSGVLAGRAGR